MPTLGVIVAIMIAVAWYVHRSWGVLQVLIISGFGALGIYLTEDAGERHVFILAGFGIAYLATKLISLLTDRKRALGHSDWRKSR